MLCSSYFRNLLPACILALILGSVPMAQAALPADGGGIAQDIASAGRLRMQSQRLAKLYQQAGMGMYAPVAIRQIGEGSAEIDTEFARLARYSRKPSIQRTFGRCETLWLELRSALKAAPGATHSERVNQLADELMLHTGKLAMLIEAEGETPVGRLLDLSSRLNMLSQRLARLYLLAHGGDKSQGVMIDLEQARKEFKVGLQELDSARENSPASREAIALAKNQWIFFDLAIGQLGKANRTDGKAAQHVATSSERIAQVLDDASAQYVKDYSGSLRSTK